MKNYKLFFYIKHLDRLVLTQMRFKIKFVDKNDIME
jgi:hypothetical protein